MFVAKHVIYLGTQIYPSKSLGRYPSYRDYPDGYLDTSWQMSTQMHLGKSYLMLNTANLSEQRTQISCNLVRFLGIKSFIEFA